MNYMSTKDDINIITIYAPDQIEVAFDRIPDEDWRDIWAKSEFPHPLITVDYNKDGIPFQVTALGELATKLLEFYAEWLREIRAAKTDKHDRSINGDRKRLIDRLAAYYNSAEQSQDGQENPR